MNFGYRKELDLFSRPLIDACLKAAEFTPYYPIINPTNRLAPIEFEINGTPRCYLDLCSSYLYVKVNVYEIKSDGSKVEPTYCRNAFCVVSLLCTVVLQFMFTCILLFWKIC